MNLRQMINAVTDVVGNMNWRAIGIAAGVSGTLFLGVGLLKKYVNYKVRKILGAGENFTHLDVLDEMEVQLYVRQELHAAYTLLRDDDISIAVRHLVNIIVLSNDPTIVLAIVKEIIPAYAVPMLLEALMERA